jgi:hypothetical protein
VRVSAISGPALSSLPMTGTARYPLISEAWRLVGLLLGIGLFFMLGARRET